MRRKGDERTDHADLRILSPDAVMPDPDRLPTLDEQPGHVRLVPFVHVAADFRLPRRKDSEKINQVIGITRTNRRV